MSRDYYTYIFFDPTRNLEPFYVGQGTRGRVLKKKNKQVESRRRDIKDAGAELIVDIISALDQNHAKFIEECLIEIYGTKAVVTGIKRGPLWNFTKGGEGTVGIIPWNKGRVIGCTGRKSPHTKETKLKISAANRGQKRHPHSPETIKKMSDIKLNKPRSEETKQKISKALIGKKKGIATGPLSKEHRMNISKARKGVPWTEARWIAQRNRNDKF